jgi:xanthine dehydrogenase accessory factor
VEDRRVTLERTWIMREILDDVLAWIEQGKKTAVATVIQVERSAPRGPGTSLAVSEDGVVTGSVSGGCVEPAVYEEAMSAIASGRAKRLRYGISDDQAFEVGLTCGGTIHLVVTPITTDSAQALVALREALADETPAALATVVEGPNAGALALIDDRRMVGSLGSSGLDYAVGEDALGMLELGDTDLMTYGPDGQRRPEDVTVFVDSFSPPPDMYVFGAIDFAAAVARVGKFLNYRVTVCDARAKFATRARFPEADEVIVRWPHEFLADAPVDKRTVICILTHDPKFDVPVLQLALKTPAAYIGAMGSRRTHEERSRELIAAGASEEDLRRIASPIGLDIGATTPEEVAVSIAGEIIASRHSAPGGRLSDRGGAIHKQQHPSTA